MGIFFLFYICPLPLTVGLWVFRLLCNEPSATKLAVLDVMLERSYGSLKSCKVLWNYPGGKPLKILPWERFRSSANVHRPEVTTGIYQAFQCYQIVEGLRKRTLLALAWNQTMVTLDLDLLDWQLPCRTTGWVSFLPLSAVVMPARQNPQPCGWQSSGLYFRPLSVRKGSVKKGDDSNWPDPSPDPAAYRQDVIESGKPAWRRFKKIAISL